MRAVTWRGDHREPDFNLGRSRRLRGLWGNSHLVAKGRPMSEASISVAITTSGSLQTSTEALARHLDS